MDSKEENKKIEENNTAPVVENNVETAKVVIPEAQSNTVNMPVSKKKKDSAGKVVALAIGCTIIGIAIGAGSVIAFDAFHGHGRMRAFRNGGRYEAGFDRQNFGDNDSKDSSNIRKKGERPNRNRNQDSQNNNGSKNNGQNGFGKGMNGNRGQQGGQWQGRGGRGQNGQDRQGQDKNNQAGNGNTQNPDANGQAPDGQAPANQAPDGNAQAPNGQAPEADQGTAN